jgi:hypothetical protein
MSKNSSHFQHFLTEDSGLSISCLHIPDDKKKKKQTYIAKSKEANAHPSLKKSKTILRHPEEKL